MRVQIGEIEAIFRYPVKSMRGEPLQSARLGWHGLDGDRRFALRRLGAGGDFPWLSASRLAEMVLFEPRGDRVVTPEGEELPMFGEALARRCGGAVEMMQMRHGVFDDGAVSVISSETVRSICSAAGQRADVRRFRPNIVVRPARPAAFEEDGWVGGVLDFGDAAVAVTSRDERCAMINIDPGDASLQPEMMKAVVRANANYAGVYCTAVRSGTVAVGQPVFLTRGET